MSASAAPTGGCQVKGRRTWIGEETARLAFEDNTGEKFPNTKNLPWNPRRELDGYCEALCVAFQYHGKQHYERVPFFHRTEQLFLDQKNRDQLTEEACQRSGVSLLTISCKVAIPEIRALVRAFLLETLGSEFVKPVEALMTPEEFASSVKDSSGELARLMDELQSVAAACNGRCVAPMYLNGNTPLEFECALGHRFEQTPKLVKENHKLGFSFCPECAEKFAEGSKKVAADVERFGFTMLRCWMAGGRTRNYRRVEVQCPLAHAPFEAPANYFQGSKDSPTRACPACKRAGEQAGAPREKTARSDADIRAEAAEAGFVFLERSMLRRVNYLKLTCPRGHEIEVRQSNFLPVTAGKPRQGCSRCKAASLGDRRVLGADEVRAKLAEWGLELLSAYVRGRERKTAELEFKCARPGCGRTFRATWNNIAKRKRKCTNCKESA